MKRTCKYFHDVFNELLYMETPELKIVFLCYGGRKLGPNRFWKVGQL